MQIVIEISEKRYKDIQRIAEVQLDMRTDTVEQIIANGTPLPKGHGDLIDRSEVIKSLFDYHNGKKTIGQCIDDVQTIIEADTEGSDDE